MSAERSLWLVSLGLLLCVAAVGCRNREPAAAATEAAAVVELVRVEVGVDAPGLSVEDVEQMVVVPIEAAVMSISGLRHTTASAREGRAQIVLEFAGIDVYAARQLVLARLAELGNSLPEGIDPPMLGPAIGPTPVTLRWSVEAERLSPDQTRAIHRDLVHRSWSLPGVLAIQDCARQEVVAVELDLEALTRFGVGSGDVARALRDALLDAGAGLISTRPSLGVEALHSVIIEGPERASIPLSAVASIRIELDEPGCVALTGAGSGASATVTLDSADARARLETMLEEIGRDLPSDVVVHRFDADDSAIELSLDPGLDPEVAIALITPELALSGKPWLLEIGVDGEPCVGSGTRARVSVAGHDAKSLALIDGLRDTIGMDQLDEIDDPAWRRAWLVGPEPDVLDAVARQRADELQRSEGLDDVVAYTSELQSQIHVEMDRERIAALGVGHAEIAEQLTLAVVGLELGALLEADGRAMPLVLRVAGLSDATPERLHDLPLRGGEGVVPLGTVAQIKVELERDRICRRDGQRGIMIALRAAQPSEWPSVARSIEPELPTNYRWVWADER